MKFSTKSRYALRLMAELARYAPGSTVSLKEISERQHLDFAGLNVRFSVCGQLLTVLDVRPLPAH